MTKRFSLDPIQTAQWLLLALVGALVALVLILAAVSRSTVSQSRALGEYTVVESVTAAQLGSGPACQSEFRFTLGQIDHTETLAFFINHHNVQVDVGGECVCTRTASEDDAFVTGGGAWVMVPLYETDSGQEVRVLLTPLYKNYRVDSPDFMLGSELAVYHAALSRALPALILSLCVIFAGVLLIFMGLYHSVKGMFSGRLHALGLMSISMGLWRIAYDRVTYLLLADQAVLVYTVSIISLMAAALCMLNSLQTDETGTKIIRLCSCGYCAVYILMLLLQAAGVADLRQTLKAVHVTIIISAAAFLISGLRQWLDPKAKQAGKVNYGWLLGLGVLIDLLLYYSAASSFNMIFTLVAILCYSVLEGTQLFFAYIERKKALEEMETQLTLSRTTTMMSQIRSHFVFNVLNAISGMCKYDPEKADETVVRFARYLRSNINIMESDRNIPFSTDLRQLEDYVALEQVRFGDKIEFYTDIEADNFLIPPLILQPVVENAIKHGVSKKRGPGAIILRTRDTGTSIVITVEDDGVGFDLAELDKEKSVGVRNIRFRLEHLVHGTLDIQSEVGVGTTVTIIIPKET